MSAKHWFRVTTVCADVREPFVDWFSATNEADALRQARQEADALELPVDAVQSVRIATQAEADICAQCV